MDNDDPVPSTSVEAIDFGRAKTRQDIIRRITLYFSLPQNIEARQDRETAQEAAERNIRKAINEALPNRFDLLSTKGNDDAWKYVKRLWISAREYPLALDGLKIVIADWLRIPTEKPPWVTDIAAQLLDGSLESLLQTNRKQLRGISGKWHEATQVIHAVDELRKNFPRFTLSGNGEKNSVYSIVSEAARDSGFPLTHAKAKKLYDRSAYRQREIFEMINKKAKNEGLAISFTKTNWVNAKK